MATIRNLLIAAMLSFALCGYAQKGEKGIGVYEDLHPQKQEC